MKRTAILFLMVLFFLFVIYDRTEAATVISDYIPSLSGSFATGIEGLQVGDTIYDVDFIYGTHPSIFGGSFDFVTVEAARAAAQAICDEFTGIIGVKDGSELSSTFYIPFYLNTSTGRVSTTKGGYSAETGWTVPQYSVENVDSGANRIWATFQVVPIPGAVWLFGSGLIGIVGSRRKLMK